MRTFCMRMEAFLLLPKRRLKMATDYINCPNMENYIIDDIFKILSDDTIYIPKSVARRDDIYDASKTLFGVIFTDCVDDLRAYGSSIDGETVGKMMKAYVMDMTISDIQCECLCSPSMASAARSETVVLINKTDLSECLRERQVI